MTGVLKVKVDGVWKPVEEPLAAAEDLRKYNGCLTYPAGPAGTGSFQTEHNLLTVTLPAGVYRYENAARFSSRSNMWAQIFFGTVASDGSAGLQEVHRHPGALPMSSDGVFSVPFVREKYHAGGSLTFGITYGFVSASSPYQLTGGQLSYQWMRQTL